MDRYPISVKPIRWPASWWLILGLTLCCTLPAQAQEFKRLDKVMAQGTAYHVFAREGEATMQVLVLGNAGSPGVYEIGVSVALDQLITLAGGTLGVPSPGSKTIVTVRLFRSMGEQRTLVYEALLEDLLATPGQYPKLQPEDVLTIEAVVHERKRFTWRDALSVLTSLTSLVLLYDRVRRL